MKELYETQKGFAVASEDLEGISLTGPHPDDLKHYCRKGSVIAEWNPKPCGFSLEIALRPFWKPILIRGKSFNFLWLHLRWRIVRKRVFGKIVYKPDADQA